MDTLILSDNEIRLIEALRSLKPHEKVEIQADVQGRPDSFLITRTTKVLLVLSRLPEYKR